MKISPSRSITTFLFLAYFLIIMSLHFILFTWGDQMGGLRISWSPDNSNRAYKALEIARKKIEPYLCETSPGR
jgi:hypothetical protein